MIRWILRLVLTLIAARLLLLATRRFRVREGAARSFDPGLTSGREKTPRVEPLSPHPIEDAEYEELPRSSG